MKSKFLSNSPIVIDEGSDGLLVTYGDAADWVRAIQELLANASKQGPMVAHGRNYYYS